MVAEVRSALRQQDTAPAGKPRRYLEYGRSFRDDQVYRHGLDGDVQVLEVLSAKQVTFSTLSPDARTVVCVVPKSRVSFWSVADGKKLYGIWMEPESEGAEVFGPVCIERNSWSPDSKYLAVYPGFPFEELTMIDVGQRQVWEIVR